MSEVLNAAVEALTSKMEDADFSNTAKFEIEGEGSIVIDGEGVRIGDDATDVTLSASAETFQAMLEGDIDPTSAFMTGKLSIDGDMGAAMQLGAFLAETMTEQAEFFSDLAEGPQDGAAWWLTADDNTRIRIGGWGAGAPNGTVLLFPGRTEYIEKYGRTAQDFLEKGYATIAIDWRGQGLADRLIDDPQKGHVHRFQDYQRDVAALIEHAEQLGYKKPYYLVAHSMGGCIGYRSLIEGLPVQAAVFTGPMWGIIFPPLLKPFTPFIARFGSALGFGKSYVPSGSNENYVQEQEFEGNTLTTDPCMYAYMQKHLNEQPQLGLGGPTFNWLDQAIDEMNFIMTSTPPKVPTRCYIGTAEKIVDPDNVHKRMADWPGAELIEISLAEHEVLMESPETRNRVTEEICEFFDKHAA